MWIWVAGYLLLINIWAFGTFALDKHRSRTGGRRIPERLLLQVAAVGGTPGAIAAQRMLRHKTRKEPFRSRLRLIGWAQAVAVTVFVCRGPLADLLLRGVHAAVS